MTARILPVRMKLAMVRLRARLNSPLRPFEGAEANLVKDVGRTWRMRSLALTLAHHKAVGRHHQSFLGALWMPLTFALFAGGISLLWAQIFDRPLATYMPYVTYGLFTWNVIVGALTDGARALKENRNLILHSSTPILIYPVIAMLKQIIMATYSIPFVLIVAVAFTRDFDASMLLALPGFLLVSLFGLGMCVSLAIICAYVPDLAEVMASGLRFAFFFTPILWLPSTSGQLEHVWMWNPFYYAIEVFRAPILGSETTLQAFAVTGALTLAVWIIAIIVYRAYSGAVSTRLGG